MNPSSWWTLKILFGATTMVLALLVAICTFVDTLKGEKQERVKAWFRRRWECIEACRWRSMPEGVINRLIELKRGLREYVHRATPLYWLILIVLLSPFLLATACFLHWGTLAAVVGFFLQVFVFGMTMAMAEGRWRNQSFSLLCLCFGVIPILFIALALQQNIFVASAIMVLLLPLFMFITFVIAQAHEWVYGHVTKEENNSEVLGLTLMVSFTVTFLSFLVGHLAEPEQWIPQTLRLLISNVFFDGATFMATIWLLAWAIKHRPLFRIPIAVALDIGLGVVFACASLYLGLVGGEHALSLREILNVLIAKSPDGTAFEIGPYFWAMHTAFLPTAVYLGIIIVAWVGKAILVPTEWILIEEMEHKNPMRLTTVLLGIFVTLFAALAYGAGVAQDYAKEHAPITQQVTEPPD